MERRLTIKRREFVTLLGVLAISWPLTARAQGTRPVIGFLVSGSADSFAIFVDAFKQGMLDNGMVEDRDYLLDLRFADGDYDRFPTLAAEVVQPARRISTNLGITSCAMFDSPVVFPPGLARPIDETYPNWVDKAGIVALQTT